METIIADKVDLFGDRMKGYEAATCDLRLDLSKPIYARIDGRCFSTWTRGAKKPFDADLSRMMIETTKYLVEQSGAVTGYTQSDEISLGWNAVPEGSSLFFDGKLLKMVSVLAGMASAKFAQLAGGHPDFALRKTPSFDCRVFSVPVPHELMNCFLWREQDALKNALIGVCFEYFSAKQIHGKHGGQQLQMLIEKGVDFQSYPLAFRQGIYVKRVVEERRLSESERMKIPENNRPAIDATFTRSRIAEMDWHLSHWVFEKKLELFFGKSSE